MSYRGMEFNIVIAILDSHHNALNRDYVLYTEVKVLLFGIPAFC